MKHLILVAGLLVSPAAMADEPYTCEKFIADYKHTTNKTNAGDDISRQFKPNVSFLLGAFYAKTEAKYVPNEDPPGLDNFEEKVINRCKTTPEQHPINAIIAEAKTLHPVVTNMASNSNDFEGISYTDLKLDFSKMLKKKVAVSGVLSGLADSYFLKGEKFSTNNIMIKTDKLDRDTRKFLLNECGGVGCSVTVRGTVQEGIFGDEIAAQSITPN